MSRAARRHVLAVIVGALVAVGFADPTGADDVLSELPKAGTEGGPTEAFVGEAADRWLHGREVFAREFTSTEGLGPTFNASSCGTCHVLPVLGGAGGLEHNVGGDEAIGGAVGYSLRSSGRGGSRRRRSVMAISRPGPPPEPRAIGIQTPSLLGLGQLESIPDHVILGREDPDDLDGDGVRGVANRIEVDLGYVELGRFGWRAQAPSLDDFVRGACGGELGLTVPWEGRGFGQMKDGDMVRDPELTRHEFVNLSIYCAELAPPPPGVPDDAEQVRRGEVLFGQAGCATCHVPVLQGTRGPVRLYSDLLTHRVVERRELTDEEKRMQAILKSALVRRARREAAMASMNGEAAVATNEKAQTDGQDEPAGSIRFRTPPLWGIARTAPYLHDGRAPTLSDAIEGHDLEAARSRDRWRGLTNDEREDLLAFLAVL